MFGVEAQTLPNVFRPAAVSTFHRREENRTFSIGVSSGRSGVGSIRSFGSASPSTQVRPGGGASDIQLSQAVFCPAIVRNGFPSRISTKPNSMSLDTCASLIIHERFAAISFSVHLRSIASRPNCASGSSLFSMAVFCLKADRHQAADGLGFRWNVRVSGLVRDTLSAHYLYQSFIPAKSSLYSSGRPTSVVGLFISSSPCL
jgi:hypothetical protein